MLAKSNVSFIPGHELAPILVGGRFARKRSQIYRFADSVVGGEQCHIESLSTIDTCSLKLGKRFAQEIRLTSFFFVKFRVRNTIIRMVNLG